MKKSYPPQNNDDLLKAYREVWGALFSTDTHLDSALSKLSEKKKPILARIIPEMLRRPVAYANALGIGMLRGEPWELSREELVNWKAGELLFRALVDDREALDDVKKGGVDDFPPEMVAEFPESALWEALTQTPPLTIRVKSAVDREALGKEMHFYPTKWSPVGLTNPAFSRILQSEAFLRGDFEIQDEGSQLMALFALSPEKVGPHLLSKPGKLFEKDKIQLSLVKPLTFIDTCAGAGGKTLAAADFLSGKGRVFAYDIYEGKLKALKRRAVRANTQNVKTLAIAKDFDATSFQKSADRVLIDAPCSGWGVLRRNPDLKWKWRAEKELDLPVLQTSLLDRFSPLVKDDGILTYGVCTFRKEETTFLIEQWLEKNPNWQCKWDGFAGPGPMDGFYMASLQRK
jgi:16S rRNA C967 or C1407 C5-methylase (RsmB/RsmF family)